MQKSWLFFTWGMLMGREHTSRRRQWFVRSSGDLQLYYARIYRSVSKTVKIYRPSTGTRLFKIPLKGFKYARTNKASLLLFVYHGLDDRSNAKRIEAQLTPLTGSTVYKIDWIQPFTNISKSMCERSLNDTVIHLCTFFRSSTTTDKSSLNLPHFSLHGLSAIYSLFVRPHQ